MRPAATGDFPLGEESYTALLREKELLGFDAHELRERGRAAYDELADDLARCARELRGTDDWKSVLDELDEDHPSTPEAMPVGFEEWTERAREYLREHRLVSFPAGDECAVVPSPPPRPVLAVASTCRRHRSATGCSAISSSLPHPTGRQRTRSRSDSPRTRYPGIPTTAVHEAYPGHHWHLVMSKSNPSRLRQAFRTPYFSEGWALYAERMMREQGFFTDLRQR